MRLRAVFKKGAGRVGKGQEVPAGSGVREARTFPKILKKNMVK